MERHEALLLAARVADLLHPLTGEERLAVFSELPWCRDCGRERPDGG